MVHEAGVQSEYYFRNSIAQVLVLRVAQVHHPAVRVIHAADDALFAEPKGDATKDNGHERGRLGGVHF